MAMMGDVKSGVDSGIDKDNAMVEEMDDDSLVDDIMEVRFIVVGKKNRKNAKLLEALKVYSQEEDITYSDTGMEHMHNSSNKKDLSLQPVFVLDNFEGNIYQSLSRAQCRIMGPPAIMFHAAEKMNLPCNRRPLYTMLMNKVVICFTGFKSKEPVARLAELTHHMGGSIRKEFSNSVTHLVANCAGGEKYRVAVSMGIPLMTVNWVHNAWDFRDQYDQHISKIQELQKHKLSPFFFSIVAFLGFTREEQRDMERTAVTHGGAVVEAGSPQCTHLVVNEHTVKTIPFDVDPVTTNVIKEEWFWACVQMEASADESIYRFQLPSSTPASLQQSFRSGTPDHRLSTGKSRKRKRLRENLAMLAHEGEVDAATAAANSTPLYKRASTSTTPGSAGSVGGVGVVDQCSSTQMSLSAASFLDDTRSPDNAGQRGKAASSDQGDNSPALNIPPPTPKAPISARQQTIMEFLQTEKNYTAILHTILKLKEEIEKPDQPKGPLLNPTQVRVIFGKIPPLYEVHRQIRDELGEMVNDWSDEKLVGNIILSRADQLMKSYPPFINYFEDTKDTLEKCMKNNQRFFAFLKVCMSKPECGRQTLKELLIRPVQRLPSIMLLLRDILKRTGPTHPDSECLEKACTELERVMKTINEDKRQTESRLEIFHTINDIENCPPELLSSHRKLIAKINVMELTNELSHRGDSITLNIFSDCLQMVKRRVKVLNSKSPAIAAAAAAGGKTPQKAYKHLDMVPLSCIKRVLNIVEAPDCKNVFALVTKKMGEAEKLFAFVIEDEMEKATILNQLSRAICDVTCRTDYATLQADVEAGALNLDTSDLGNKTISKAANRFSKRVSRAFSFNKTPRKLKRAMSSMTQMMSPFSSRRDSSIYVPSTSSAAAAASGTPCRSGSTTHPHTLRLGSVQDLHMEERENQYSELVDSVSLGRTPHMGRRLLSSANESESLQYEPCKKRRASMLPLYASTPSWRHPGGDMGEMEEEDNSIYHSPPHHHHHPILDPRDHVELDEVSIHSDFSEASAMTMPVLGAMDRRRDILTGSMSLGPQSVKRRRKSTRLSAMFSVEEESASPFLSNHAVSPRHSNTPSKH